MTETKLFVAGASLLALMLCGCGRNSVEMTAERDWLLIPASDRGPVASLAILSDGKNILGEAQLINPAPDTADYWIPVDISDYRGRQLEIVIDSEESPEAALSAIRQSDSRELDLDEPYRQVYHFTPEFGWTNDPNGMVWHDGEYHLAYQANPYGTKHFNMHWGNAVSTDLVHWTDLPFIVAPDELGAIFSGSAVVDIEGTAGFGENAIVAMYTSASDTQKQSIAWSTDGGRSYTKHDGNPVLEEPGIKDFRDPKLLRHGDSWIVSVAAGDRIIFYESDDLKEWTRLSEFGEGIGAHGGVWECPDLIPMEYGGQRKWVLIVNINPGGPNGGSAAQYFIGDFDGTSFTADPLPYPLWVDEGMDNYAGVTFSNTGDRQIFLGWLSNWLYSEHTPTVNFRNGMTIARDLSLRSNGEHLFLASSPSPEILSARCEAVSFRSGMENGVCEIPQLLPENDGAYELCMTVTPGKSGKFELQLGNSLGEKAVWSFDFNNLSLNLDRSESGRTDFSDKFGKSDIRAKLVKRDRYELRLFVDRQSTELFINDGDVSFTNSIFPNEAYNSLSLTSPDARVSGIKVYRLE